MFITSRYVFEVVYINTVGVNKTLKRPLVYGTNMEGTDGRDLRSKS